MAATNKVTVSMRPAVTRPTYAERRAAQSATLSGDQARLKQEAADRRLKRAEEAASAPPSKPPGVKRRPR